jgi:tetratricopeptide (TPR) repeat protein
VSQVDDIEVPVITTRLWRNHLGVEYKKVVHETPDESITEKGLKLGCSDARINHVGFQDKDYNKKKALRIIDALEYEPHYYSSYYLAIAWHQAGDAGKAMAFMNKALGEPMPDNIKAHAHSFLADIYRLQGNFFYRLADERLEDSLKLAPQQNTGHLIKADMLSRFGHRDEALAEIEILMARDTQSSDMHQDTFLTKEQVKEEYERYKCLIS